MRIGSLFTGYGGLDLAAEQVFGGHTVWTSDVDDGACKIIAHRWEDAPNLGDITKIRWSQVPPIDILTGGFPCQDLSMAGRRAGMRSGTRSGLWTHMAYAIDQLRPRYVIAENVRGLLSGQAHSDVEPCPICLGDGPDGHMRALGAVLADLADLGYDTQWCGLRAADVGAPHGRFRIFLVAADTRRSDGRGEDPGRHTSDRKHLAPAGRVEGASTPIGRGGTALFPTPRVTLDVEARLLPTPNAGLGEHGRDNGQPPAPRRAKGRQVSTADVVRYEFGQYSEAVARWEPILGREAPDPTIGGRLSPLFVEWLMGLPAGWITDVPGLSRAQQLKALGNGVVPQQAAAALSHMINSREVTAA